MALLLDLAPELLTAVLRLLSYKDLLQCLRVCRLFHDIISKSPEIDYLIHLQVAGMWDNPRCSLPIPLRKSLLDKREAAWHFFNPSGLTKGPIPVLSSALFDLSPTTLSLGTAPNDDTFETEGIAFLHLPFLPGAEDSSRTDTMAWDFIQTGMTILEYALSLEVNDLFVLVVSEAETQVASTKHLAIILLQYSTKKTHELAEKPVISLCAATVEMGVPRIGLDVSEENLAVSIVFSEPTARAAASSLCVYNWRTGKSKTDPMTYRIPVFDPSVFFLTNDILINPNTIRRSIDIFHIRPSASISPSDPLEVVVRLIHSLALPILHPEALVLDISCIGRPNAASRFPKYVLDERPFVNDPENGIIACIITVFDANTDRQTFSMIMRRRSLLDLIPSDRIDAEAPTAPMFQGIRADIPRELCSIQPWESWGPPVTRWFSGRHLQTGYITCISGSRYVQYLPSGLGHDAREIARNRNTIRILDFNPAMVKIARHRNWEQRELDEADLKIFDSNDPEYTVCPADQVFASDIFGALPFVECKSRMKWDFDEVLMSEGYLLGSKNDRESRRMKEIVLIHFG